MPVKPGERYAAKVVGAETTTNNKGTSFMSVRFSTSDGEITRDLALTQAAAAYTAKALKILGATEDHLASEEFYDNPMEIIGSAVCEITTKARPYRDNVGIDHMAVEVEWINSLRKPRATRSSCQQAANLFRKADQSAVGFDDVPF